MASSLPSAIHERVAVIDLACFDDGDSEGKRRVAKALNDAFSDTGFAIVTGASVSPSLTSELRQNATSFFGLSRANKEAVNTGFDAGYGKSPYSCEKENVAQVLGDFTKANDPVETLIFSGPSDPVLRKTPTDLSLSYLNFNDGLGRLRTTLEKASEIALGLEEGFFGQRCEHAPENLRLAYYPDSVPRPGQLRYGAHVDSFGITLLSLDPLHPKGLQVQIDNEWVDVPFIENSFVLNVGAMLSRWTNGAWKAALHRVVFTPGQRLSIVSGHCDHGMMWSWDPSRRAWMKRNFLQ